GAPLVLKLLQKERTDRWRFLREFCTHLCLRGHLTCLQVLPVAFETPTHFAFRQELTPAGDLCGLLTPGVGLPEPQVKRCASQVSSALSYLHGHAMVHRDLKLDNVLAFDPECQLVKLGDFGLTRVTGWQVGPSPPGPAPYAPPELCHLSKGHTLHLEPSLDTWAFGILLFSLLTGSFPWEVAAPEDEQFQEFQVWQGRTWRGAGVTSGG
ncbi:SBK1 kinase, partial [Serilophus lunatus]|nr:SBK1 kinase [Serilophus lunatus]